MARTRKEHEKEVKLARQGLLLVALFLGALTWASTRSLAAGLAVFIVLLMAAEALLVLPSIIRKRRWKAAGIADVDRMNDFEFEEFLGNLFRAKGYRTQFTPVNDYGGDVIADGPGGRLVVQAKHRTREDVGLRAVQEAHTALGYYRGTMAVVVTNRYFTQQAITLAKANKVELWDRDRLAVEILALRAPTASVSTVSAP